MTQPTTHTRKHARTRTATAADRHPAELREIIHNVRCERDVFPFAPHVLHTPDRPTRQQENSVVPRTTITNLTNANKNRWDGTQ